MCFFFFHLSSKIDMNTGLVIDLCVGLFCMYRSGGNELCGLWFFNERV